MKLQYHLHYTDLKNESLQQQNLSIRLQKMVDAEEN